MVIYVPGTEETDQKKQNMSLQQLGTAIADIYGAWIAYTPTITPQGGAFTGATIVASGRYKKIGKTVLLQADVLLTALGSGVPTGGLRISIPFTAAAFNFAGYSREVLLTGKSGSANVIANGTTLDARDADNATYISAGNQIIVGVPYEIP